jgi:ribosomal protein S18 acetylase RimI-like enzyme
LRADEILELSDLNLAEATREMARWHPLSELSETRDLLMVAGPDPFPVGYGNAALCLGAHPQPAPDTALAEVACFFDELERGYTVWSRAHVDSDLEKACDEAGLVRLGDAPGMVLTAPGAGATPHGVRVRQVDDVAGVAAFAQTAARSYAPVGLPPEVTAHIFEVPERLLRPHLVLVLAEQEGEPRACAMAILSHGIAGLYWVGTVAEGRRRGLGELVTRAAGNAAFERGARLVVLQASEQGEPVYRRMGYREITRYRWHVRLRPPERGSA